MGRLISIHLGLQCGLALFDMEGQLIDWRTQRFPDRTRFKAAVPAIIDKQGKLLDAAVADGDPRIAKVWSKEIRNYGIIMELVAADAWRKHLLKPSERRARKDAKAAAVRIAEGLIKEHGATRPVACDATAAAAICLGHWALRCGIDDGGWTS